MMRSMAVKPGAYGCARMIYMAVNSDTCYWAGQLLTINATLRF